MFASAVLRPVAPRVDVGRLAVLDVARGFAILAMLIAHAAPLLSEIPRHLAFVGFQLNDVASPLFASVMGSTAAIAVARVGKGRPVVPLLLQNTVRGLLLVALGMLLDAWGSWIAVILSLLGIVLVIGTPVLLLSTRTLLALLIVLVVVSAPLNAAITAVAGVLSAPIEPGGLVLNWFFLDPHYRVTNLLPWFVFGGLLFRIGFDSRRTSVALLAAAAPLWLIPPVAQLLGGFASVASGTYLDTLHDAGLVFAVLGTIMMLASVTSGPGAAIVAGLFLPLRAIGSQSLTLYVLQVAVVAGLARAGLPIQGSNDLGAWALLVLGLPLVAILWWRFVGKGPVEWAIGVLSGWYRTRN